MRKSLTGRPMEDGSMMQFVFRKAAKEDVPNLIMLCKETIVEVYGQILPWEKLEPWVEGDMVGEVVNKQWQVSAITTGPWDSTGPKAGSSFAKRWTKRQAP